VIPPPASRDTDADGPLSVILYLRTIRIRDGPLSYTLRTTLNGVYGSDHTVTEVISTLYQPPHSDFL
jgi:hypothetical protein